MMNLFILPLSHSRTTRIKKNKSPPLNGILHSTTSTTTIRAKSNHSHSSSGPSSSTSWERGAKLVKATEKTNKYLDHIRESHDPSLHLKTLEDELKGTMSKALGNQGEKVLALLQSLHQERSRYEDILSSALVGGGHKKMSLVLDGQEGTNTNSSKNNEYQLDNLTHAEKLSLFLVVQNHNRLRADALHARWELLVHRQAVGFITNNHKFVHDKFPVPESLKLPGKQEEWSEFQDEYSINSPSDQKKRANQLVVKEAVTRNFGDQLDWWERIGRWR